MKQDATFFEGKEPKLLYIARKLNDALRLESVLDAGGCDYGVEADRYRGGVVFASVRVGAFFYVLPEAFDHAASVMAQGGFEPLPRSFEWKAIE